MSQTGHIVAAAQDSVSKGSSKPLGWVSNSAGDAASFERDAALRDQMLEQRQSNVVGLTTESRVVTERGRLSIGALVAGDKLWTLDSGMRPLSWVVQRRVKFTDKTAHLRPIIIEAGAFGQGAPLTPIRVAPGQRLLINDWRAKRYFNLAEVLVRAVDLVGQPGISRDDSCDFETYAYLHFDGFELIETSGVISESFVHERRLDLYRAGALRNATSLAPSRPVIDSARCKILHEADVYDPVDEAKRREGGLRSFVTAPRRDIV